MSNVKSLVDNKIDGKKVMVFSKSSCPYCHMAKNVFNKLIKEGKLTENDYDVMEIGNNPDCGAIQDYLKTLTGGRTVPRVFIGGKFIGGGSEVEEMDENGELVKLL